MGSICSSINKPINDVSVSSAIREEQLNIKKQFEEKRILNRFKNASIKHANILEKTTNMIEYIENKTDINSLVEHYIPPEFPLDDYLTKIDLQKCKLSWKHIQDNHLVCFIDDFYKLLFAKSNRLANIFLSTHDKASILLRSISFILHTDTTIITAKKYIDLAILHTRLNIPMWLFGTYITIMIETISVTLGELATRDTMEAWVRLASYNLRKMIKSMVNTKSYIGRLDFNVNSHESTIALKLEPSVNIAASNINPQSGLFQLKKTNIIKSTPKLDIRSSLNKSNRDKLQFPKSLNSSTIDANFICVSPFIHKK
jgi:hemoglobin-like flavoprotein